MGETAAIFQNISDFISKDLSLNSLYAYLIALGIALGGTAVVLVARGVIARRMQAWIERAGRYGRVDRTLAAALVNSVVLLLPLLPIYWALSTLSFPQPVTRAISVVFLLVFTLSMVRFLANFAGFLVDAALRGRENSIRGTRVEAGVLMPIVHTVVWALGITFLLDNLGFQISSIVAGLGIMGVAVGLAGQAILADFFSYLVILIDRPFTIGDTINLGTIMGRVEHIGIKTTRLRTAGGEVLVCPNGELTRQRLGNLNPASQRGRTLTFGVTYETPLEKLRAIQDMVIEVVAGIDGLVLERVHFLAMSPSSLDFEVGVHVPGSDGLMLLDAVHEFNLALMERFAAEGIDFACPTRRVVMEQTPSTPKKSV